MGGGLRFQAFDKRDAIFRLTHECLSCPPESLSSLQPGPAVCGELIEYRCKKMSHIISLYLARLPTKPSYASTGPKTPRNKTYMLSQFHQASHPRYSACHGTMLFILLWSHFLCGGSPSKRGFDRWETDCQQKYYCLLSELPYVFFF